MYFLADLSAEVFQTYKGEPALHSLAWAERRLRRVDWTFFRPVQEVVSRISHFLRLNSSSSAVIAEVGQGRIGLVALLVHLRLMAIGINVVVKEGNVISMFPLPVRYLCVERDELGAKRGGSHCVCESGTTC